MEFPCDNEIVDDLELLIASSETFSFVEQEIEKNEERGVFTPQMIESTSIPQGYGIREISPEEYVVIDLRTQTYVSSTDFQTKFKNKVSCIPVVKSNDVVRGVNFLHHLAHYESIYYQGQKIEYNTFVKFDFSDLDILFNKDVHFPNAIHKHEVRVSKNFYGTLLAIPEVANITRFRPYTKQVYFFMIGQNCYMVFERKKKNTMVVTKCSEFFFEGGTRYKKQIYVYEPIREFVISEGDYVFHQLEKLRVEDLNYEDYIVEVDMQNFILPKGMIEELKESGKVKDFNLFQSVRSQQPGMFDIEWSDNLTTVLMQNADVSCDLYDVRNKFYRYYLRFMDTKHLLKYTYPYCGTIIGDVLEGQKYSPLVLYADDNNVYHIPMNYSPGWCFTAQSYRHHKLISRFMKEKSEHGVLYSWFKVIDKVSWPPTGSLKRGCELMLLMAIKEHVSLSLIWSSVKRRLDASVFAALLYDCLKRKYIVRSGSCFFLTQARKPDSCDRTYVRKSSYAFPCDFALYSEGLIEGDSTYKVKDDGIRHKTRDHIWRYRGVPDSIFYSNFNENKELREIVYMCRDNRIMAYPGLKSGRDFKDYMLEEFQIRIDSVNPKVKGKVSNLIK